MEGFTRKYLNDDLTEWSLNETHYVANDGTEMNFTWEGPASLGETAWSGEKTLFLTDARYDYELRAWCFPIATQEDALRNFDKDTIVNWDANATIYTENDYYDFTDGEKVARVIFKITRNIDGIEYIGYACYFDNYETNVCYQITYLEKAEVFDDTHALNVVNSLDFWNDYTPLDTTTE